MKNYFPILLSKAGEFKALAKLSQNVKDEIAPIIQVIPDNFQRVEAFAITEWSFNGNSLYLDFSLVEPFDRVTTRNLIQKLVAAGVNVVPVIQSDSDPRHKTLLNTLMSTGYISDLCIRFSSSSGGFLHIDTQISNIMSAIAISRPNISLLFDFGYIEDHNYQLVAALAINTINNLAHNDEYDNIIVASGSFLENLSSLQPAGRLYRLQRYEWDIWQDILSQPGMQGLVKYGDYGTKYPYYSEANFQGTCSIRYTTPEEFIVYRGELSGNHALGNGQYLVFADRLVRSPDYSGSAFSWGDEQIDYYAAQLSVVGPRKTGNATTWVEISQNHHITLLHSIL